MTGDGDCCFLTLTRLSQNLQICPFFIGVSIFINTHKQIPNTPLPFVKKYSQLVPSATGD